MDLCTQCPRNCRVDRTNGTGFCGVPASFRIARAALHPWEEPSVSGKNGSGTIFFCGCNLRCVFCQNRDISRGDGGEEVSPERLRSMMLDLQEAGAANINLVTPTHYAAALVPVLREVRPLLHVPIVYNCGGYEKVETLRLLDGLIDVYLPDCKYYDSDLSARYSTAPDYFPVCMDALGEMLRQVGTPRFSPDGILLGGMIVRHLVLPGSRLDSQKVVQALAERFGTSSFLLSLMSQYTPDFAFDAPDPVLHRRVTSFEYESVLRLAESLGFDGYFQRRSSACASYTPKF